MTEKTEYITASIELLEKRDELNSDELAVLCNLKKFMYQSSHQPMFAVGEYYSFTTYRKDYDADTTFIFKTLETKNSGIRVIEYDFHGKELGEYVYDIDSDFLKEAKPATAEQIADFKKAKIKNDIDFIIKDGDGDWIEIVENIQDYLQTAEELQEVENND